MGEVKLGSDLVRWLPIEYRRPYYDNYNAIVRESGVEEANERFIKLFEKNTGVVRSPNLPVGRTLHFDIECYKNYFLLTFLDHDDDTLYEYEMFNDEPINHLDVLLIIRYNRLITFNGNGYDLPQVDMFLDGVSCARLHQQSTAIIVHKQRIKNSRVVDHIDISKIFPGFNSMKMLGCRIGFMKLQELPVDPQKELTRQEAFEIRMYCRNDVKLTKALFLEALGGIELREMLSEKYGMDLRSNSQPEIAGALISKYLSDNGVSVKKRTAPVYPFKYRLPEWVKFETPEMQEALDRVLLARFATNPKSGHVRMPEILDDYVEFDGNNYKFGIGGLHSSESDLVTKPTDNQRFGEFDVASMYPSIIIEQKLFPLHLGEGFLKVYKGIKDERLVAKRTGDKVKNETYKVVLNSSYGLFGSQHSFLYSPELLVQTTITGQLSLLMLIERMTLVGGKVVSANTDGVNVLFDKAIEDDIFAVKSWWEGVTTYELEFTEYKATYNRDVNTYIALKEGEEPKAKGAFGKPTTAKNPQTPIVNDALIKFLDEGVPPATTIRNCKDPFRFTSCQKVTGGAQKDGEDVGYVVRWYYSTNTTSPIVYKTNGDKVSKTDGAVPTMDLPTELWSDLDYDWYINECQSRIDKFI